MKKLFLSLLLFFGSGLYSFGVYQYCDDCWQPTYWDPYYGYVSINWTFTGGGSDCWNSYQSNNMYPWSTAYVFVDGELVDIVHYENSTYVTCGNYI